MSFMGLGRIFGGSMNTPGDLRERVDLQEVFPADGNFSFHDMRNAALHIMAHLSARVHASDYAEQADAYLKSDPRMAALDDEILKRVASLEALYKPNEPLPFYVIGADQVKREHMLKALRVLEILKDKFETPVGPNNPAEPQNDPGLPAQFTIRFNELSPNQTLPDPRDWPQLVAQFHDLANQVLSARREGQKGALQLTSLHFVPDFTVAESVHDAPGIAAE